MLSGQKEAAGGRPLRIALIGTRGVPARYGGFETAVEEVGTRLVERGHEVLVYCRRAADADPDEALPESYRGMQLVHLPALRRRSLETLSHTALSVAHQIRWDADAAIVFNAANAPLLPALRMRGIPVATHVDGLEWKRAKWGGAGRRYYRAAEALAVRWSDALIADARGIQDYYTEEFGAATVFIPYGSPRLEDVPSDLLATVGLEPGAYHLVVSRFEPENHVAEIVEGYHRSAARLPLVVAGSAPYADAYTARIHAAGDDRMRFLGGVWDQALLDQLYAHALVYLHGHSVGGTNPSLLRAIGAGTAATAFDVSFNREVLGDAGRYFTSADDVARLIEASEGDPAAELLRGEASRARARSYDWDDVAESYETLCLALADGACGERASGRRHHAPAAVPVAGALVPTVLDAPAEAS